MKKESKAKPAEQSSQSNEKQQAAGLAPTKAEQGTNKPVPEVK